MKRVEGYYQLKCNFHTHFIEAFGEYPEIMVNAYHRAGYDCIALTEHYDLVEDLNFAKRAQEYAQKRYSSDFLVIPGLEIGLKDSAYPGAMRDLLALFVDSHISRNLMSEGMDLDTSLNIVLNEIHQKNGIAIIAHDHRTLSHWDGESTPDWIWDHREDKEIDGWEIGNGSGYYEKLSDGSNCMLSHPEESVNERYCVTANSDAHNKDDMRAKNICYTYVFAYERTIEGVKDALLNRRTIAYCNGAAYGLSKWLNHHQDY
ncbi:MAG: hypothetical protein Q7J55_02190 [bacterium]|nr:hypothetical protein [bacterium]